jgi:Cu-processing system permease protein
MLYNGMFFGEQIASILLLLGLGLILTLLFTGIGFWLGLAFFEDRIKGLGFALVGWLFLAVLYDGLVLLTIFVLGDYPIEKPMLALTMLNPIDLARITVLLEFDISALMGYTGAVFNRFFGSFYGMITAVTSMLIWLALPLYGATKRFRKMDF